MKFKLNKNLFKVIYEGIEGYVITNNTLECNKGDWTVFTTFTNETITGVASFKRAEWNYASNGLYNLKAIASTFPLGDLPQFVIGSGSQIISVIDELFQNWDSRDVLEDKELKQIDAFNKGWDKHAEKYKFTEEDVKKAIQLVREADSIDGVVDLPIVLNYPNADNSNLQIKWTEKEIIQSLQKPKEITEIEFEMEINQCDGCRAGYPIKNKIHQVPYPNGSMVCKADMYNKINIRITTDFPNGLLTIKNVKYG